MGGVQSSSHHWWEGYRVPTRGGRGTQFLRAAGGAQSSKQNFSRSARFSNQTVQWPYFPVLRNVNPEDWRQFPLGVIFTFKFIRNSPIQYALKKTRDPPDSTILHLKFRIFRGWHPQPPGCTLCGPACLPLACLRNRVNISKSPCNNHIFCQVTHLDLIPSMQNLVWDASRLKVYTLYNWIDIICTVWYSI